MLEQVLQGIQDGVADEINRAINSSARSIKKKLFSLILQSILFGASAIFLLLGVIFSYP